LTEELRAISLEHCEQVDWNTATNLTGAFQAI